MLQIYAKFVASCTAQTPHSVDTFPHRRYFFARVKSLSNLQYRAQRILEEPVVEKPDFRLFKKIQMRGAREIDERRRIC